MLRATQLLRGKAGIGTQVLATPPAIHAGLNRGLNHLEGEMWRSWTKGILGCGGLTKVHMMLRSASCLGFSDLACFQEGVGCVASNGLALAVGPGWVFSHLPEAPGLLDGSGWSCACILCSEGWDPNWKSNLGRRMTLERALGCWGCALLLRGCLPRSRIY